MLQWLAPRPSGPVEYLIVGLGNPGKKYEGTRHNAGFMALDVLAARCGAQVSRAKFHGLCGGAEVGGRRALLLKPATFMNLSGQSVCEAQAFYKIPPEKTILLSDDISLAPRAHPRAGQGQRRRPQRPQEHFRPRGQRRVPAREDRRGRQACQLGSRGLGASPRSPSKSAPCWGMRWSTPPTPSSGWCKGKFQKP